MTAPLDPMNLDPFEQQLRRQPLRTVPEGWKEEILSAARLAGTRASGELAPRVPAGPWWRAWLWPNPTAWAALAAMWVVIIGLHWDTPSSPSVTARQTVASSDALRLYAEQHRELGRILGTSTESKPKPSRNKPPGAGTRRGSTWS